MEDGINLMCPDGQRRLCVPVHADAVALLLDRGASIATTDWGGRTVLRRAAEQGHADVVALLERVPEKKQKQEESKD